MLTGLDARKKLEELLSESDNKKYGYKFQYELAKDNSYGYFKDDNRYIAFDNRTGMCNTEEFEYELSAKGWCEGKELDGQGRIAFKFYQDVQVEMTERTYFTIYAMSYEETLEIAKAIKSTGRVYETEQDIIKQTDNDYLYDTSQDILKKSFEIFDYHRDEIVSKVTPYPDVVYTVNYLAAELAEKELINRHHPNIIIEDLNKPEMQREFEELFKKFYTQLMEL